MEVLRMMRPTLVTRGSSFILKITPPAISFRAISSALRASASMYMERNFHMVNSCPSARPASA
jgi:hypothetical protein